MTARGNRTVSLTYENDVPPLKDIVSLARSRVELVILKIAYVTLVITPLTKIK